ncbi:restriction endonuclease subunit S [Luteolibacter algae]|uniref:Restriction endonuclease subunit S n=1 Tax=Luteolibacter algae TaxID=454151 RepID=A0ABW5DB67_9BACT
MRTELQSVKVSDLQAEKRWALNGGPFGSKLSSKHYADHGVPVIRGKNLSGPTKFSFEEFVYVTEKKADELRANNAHPGDLVFTQRGTLGQVGLIPADSPIKRFVISQSQMKLTVDESKADPLFLYYYFTSEETVQDMHNMAFSSGVPHINLGLLRDYKVNLPDLPTQRKIAGILSAYDDLMENNLRRIKILEQMAQSLYREWFVHFRFPGHESVKFKDSELGRIPEGWVWRKVGNAFEIQGGGTPSTTNEEYWVDGDIQWYSPRDLTAEGTMFIEKSAARINELGLRKSAAKMFPAYSVMLTSRATIGAIAINTVPSCTNQGFITCLPNSEVPIYFLYQWLKANVETFILHASGATFKEISRGVFKGLDFLQPQAELVQRYQQVVSPIADQLLNLQRRNQTLRRTRDLLLPKLLSPSN